VQAKDLKTGLTLIEIMVVVAIIGILAGLTVPNFLRAVKLARKTRCQNNLKLINNVKELYLFDHPEVAKNALIDPAEFCGTGKYIEEPASKLYCPEGTTSYPKFYLDKSPVCPHGPTTTDPQGDGTYPEHTVP
jgi:prepilin-type N-terminal cleavage/methylation domain-containing protein